MPRRGRSKLAEQTVFFVTTTIKDWEELFTERQRLEILRQLVFGCAVRHKSVVLGYALMPNHIHLLVNVPGGGPVLSRLMRDIKSLSARRLYPDRKGIWMERFDDLALYSREHFQTKLQYIHYNPVRAGLVEEETDYDFSSARDWAGLRQSAVCTDLARIEVSSV